MQRGDIRLSDWLEGSFELQPVQLSWSSGAAEDYPAIVPLMEVDHRRLLAEFRESQTRLSQDYFSERTQQLPGTIEEVTNTMKEYGFYSHYEVFGIHLVDSVALAPAIGPYTRELFTSILGPTCRAHYALGKPGWRTIFHKDCDHLRQHGFRLNIPLSTSAHFDFLIDGEIHSFELQPGRAWFVNNAREHSAHNPQSVERVSILAQLLDDHALRPGV